MGKLEGVVLPKLEPTFQQRLFQLIKRSGMTDTTVYKKAYLERRLFSKIRSHVDYQPKKKTAVALALALELDMETTRDLLARAGIALSACNEFDLIIMYSIKNKIYDIYDIDEALYEYGQPLLAG